MPKAARRIVPVAAILLAALGIVAAVQRIVDVFEHPPPGALSSPAREQLALTADLMGIRPGTAEHRELERRSVEALAKFHVHRPATLVHMLAGSLLLAMAFLQFSPRLRGRWPAAHRWTGRFLLVMVLGAAASGLFFALVSPLGGFAETSAVVVFGGFFAFAGARGWLAIRQGRRAAHREWMIRMFAIALGIAVMRVVLLGVIGLFDLGLRAFEPEVFGATLWIGWFATLAAAEAYIRATRAPAQSPAWNPDHIPV